jgi:peptidyl-tRNA hydrolase
MVSLQKRAVNWVYLKSLREHLFGLSLTELHLDSNNNGERMDNPERAATLECTEVMVISLEDAIAPQLKMWAIVRRDLKMSKGKLVPQSGHAFLDCGLNADPKVLVEYQKPSKAKISLRVKSERQLFKAHDPCVAAGLNTYLVLDGAKTFFPEPTYTMFAVGPCYRHQVPKKVDDLPML